MNLTCKMLLLWISLPPSEWYYLMPANRGAPELFYKWWAPHHCFQVWHCKLQCHQQHWIITSSCISLCVCALHWKSEFCWGILNLFQYILSTTSILLLQVVLIVLIFFKMKWEFVSFTEPSQCFLCFWISRVLWPWPFLTNFAEFWWQVHKLLEPASHCVSLDWHHNLIGTGNWTMVWYIPWI